MALPVLAETQSPVHSFTLDNGLRILVREDRRAPVVTSQLWVNVGSSYEPPGQSGLSHALEHMLYKGSSKASPGDFTDILGRLGASENAFTNEDSTVYHQTVSATHLNTVLELTADIFSTARLSAQEFGREIEVIKTERRRNVDNSPTQFIFEKFNPIAYSGSGYRTPIIGRAADLQRMRIDDLRAWYQAWYVPNNATLVLVGDVQLAEVKILAQRYFGALPAKAIGPARRPLEPNNPGRRHIYLQDANALPSLHMAFNVPSHATSDDSRSLNALRLLDSLLTGGYSSRIQAQLLLKKSWLVSSRSQYEPFKRGDTLFIISTQLNSAIQKSPEAVRKGIWAILEDLKANPPSPQELDRARTLINASLIYGRDSITQQANELGTLASANLPLALLANEMQDLANVTPEDVSLAARTYFTEDRLSVAFVNAKDDAHE
jgi:zinc protease